MSLSIKLVSTHKKPVTEVLCSRFCALNSYLETFLNLEAPFASIQVLSTYLKTEGQGIRPSAINYSGKLTFTSYTFSTGNLTNTGKLALYQTNK